MFKLAFYAKTDTILRVS